VKSQYIHRAPGAIVRRSSCLWSTRSRQSRTRWAAVSGASPQGHRGVATSGTFCANRKARSPTLPVRICVRRELSCLWRCRCFFRASYENRGRAAGAASQRLSGDSPVFRVQRRFQCTHRISSGVESSVHPWVLIIIVGSLTGTPTSHSLLVGGSGSVAEADLSRS